MASGASATCGSRRKSTREPGHHQLHTHIQWQEQKRDIWLDGRAHPPEYAPHTWQGFSTARWDGSVLVVRTTHLKQGWVRRNGLFISDRATMEERFIRHGNYLTHVYLISDPVYLDRAADQDQRLPVRDEPQPGAVSVLASGRSAARQGRHSRTTSRAPGSATSSRRNSTSRSKRRAAARKRRFRSSCATDSRRAPRAPRRHAGRAGTQEQSMTNRSFVMSRGALAVFAAAALVAIVGAAGAPGAGAQGGAGAARCGPGPAGWRPPAPARRGTGRAGRRGPSTGLQRHRRQDRGTCKATCTWRSAGFVQRRVLGGR